LYLQCIPYHLHPRPFSTAVNLSPNSTCLPNLLKPSTPEALKSARLITPLCRGVKRERSRTSDVTPDEDDRMVDVVECSREDGFTGGDREERRDTSSREWELLYDSMVERARERVNRPLFRPPLWVP